MYSRYGDIQKRPVRLPEHYGGSAFSQKPTEAITVSKREPTKSYPHSGVEEKASPAANRLLHAEAVPEETDDCLSCADVPTVPTIVEDATEVKEDVPALATDKKTSMSPLNLEGIRRLFSGADGEADHDRLLLLGLILLLSRTEGESDILLWLSLLFLCG